MQIQYTDRGFPFIDSPVFWTSDGTPYLKSPGVAMTSRPEVDLRTIQPFLDGFAPGLGFSSYLVDHELPAAEQLVKFNGQACYLSLGSDRTHNKDVAKYIQNLKESGHGSVTEHANFSFFFWGIDRSVTHELVRHRAGYAFSQVSQRYVDGSKLRFVERPEYQVERIAPLIKDLAPEAAHDIIMSVENLHHEFEGQIDLIKEEYNDRSSILIASREHGHPMLKGGNKTELRKQVNQVARECLPNCTEAPIGVTANVRAWRHFLEMRANRAADVQIRELAMMVYACLVSAAPVLFGDYEIVDLETGTQALQTPYRKV